MTEETLETLELGCAELNEAVTLDSIEASELIELSRDERVEETSLIELLIERLVYKAVTLEEAREAEAEERRLL